VLESPLVVRADAEAPRQPTVEWQVCGQCNYDCSYCIQAKKHRVGAPDDVVVDKILAFLRVLPGRWEIKTSGGEPFSTKLFLERIVPGLVDAGHVVSTLTNLSAPVAQLERYARVTGVQLGVVSASLHLEFTTPATFLAKLTAMRAAAHDDARFVVNCVLAPARLREIVDVKRAVVDAGFRFFPQLMKVKHGVHAYTREDWAIVADIVGDVDEAARLRSANLAPAYTGRACWSGARYFVLDQRGDAWSCRSAKRVGEGYLGNAVDDTLRLRDYAVECAYTICPCTTPANRGMIDGVTSSIELEVDA
jgi:MoaA/NifB/PqqE/SkfB family radical SAM enzyme